MSATRLLEIIEEGGGRWRWVFSDGDLRLPSNQSYTSAEEARSAARIAYPDTPEGASGSLGVAPPGRRPSLLARILMTLVVWRAPRD